MRNKQSGFTLIELLVVVVVIGLIAAIALPNFIGAKSKASTAQVKDNMHTVQVAAESYAADTGGLYALSASMISPYYAGGSMTQGGSAGVFPPNPFTPGTHDLPTDGANITTLAAARAQPPGSVTGNAGQVQYSQVNGSDQGTYGVFGMDDHGRSVGAATGQLVLSNQ